ncbi:MAG: GTP-binding protein [Candidatus Lokiarchaeota archaeon]|nr:GTP-binding protein [Candidatus Lokiarchaeota archaeon]
MQARSDEKSDLMFKICLFGDGGVGKTTLVNRYLTGVFKTDSSITIGVEFHIKKIQVEDYSVTLQIWDFAGEERFRFLLQSYVLGASGGIFMYDITRYSSMKNFEDWIEIFKRGFRGDENQLPVIMVGGKLDLRFKRAVSSKDAFDIAKNHNLYGFVECSSKDGKNIEDIFYALAKLMMQRAEII